MEIVDAFGVSKQGERNSHKIGMLVLSQIWEILANLAVRVIVEDLSHNMIVSHLPQGRTLHSIRRQMRNCGSECSLHGCP